LFEVETREGVTRLRRADTRWLSTGWDGGEREAECAYNVTVPEGWPRVDIESYLHDRLSAVGVALDGPALLTGVEQRHARVARFGSVTALATAGLSNPATLPLDPDRDGGPPGSDPGERRPGTVNLFVGTTRACVDGALSGLVATATEAKTATLLAETGFSGTTSDAVIVACDPAGEPVEYVGSATEVGSAVRACVRDALLASLRSRYAEEGYPESVAEAAYGIETRERATVETVPGTEPGK
jgi:adenosylcobinamide hydrolase